MSGKVFKSYICRNIIKAKKRKNRGKVYNQIGEKEVSINVVDFKVQNDRISQIIDFFLFIYFLSPTHPNYIYTKICMAFLLYLKLMIIGL